MTKQRNVRIHDNEKKFFEDTFPGLTFPKKMKVARNILEEMKSIPKDKLQPEINDSILDIKMKNNIKKLFK